MANSLPQVGANHTPLTPLSFLRRTVQVHPNQVAVVHGDRIKRSYSELGLRCAQLAKGLSGVGVGEGDRVTVVAVNTPEMLECHFGVPMIGAILNAVNVRLEPASIAWILDDCQPTAILVDSQFSNVVSNALKLTTKCQATIIDIVDSELTEPSNRIGSVTYQELLEQQGEDCSLSDFVSFPKTEWDAISLNYTSGTTGKPKGVVYSHRGAYLNSLGNVMTWGGMSRHPVYLWTVPMFHCNGWCFPWTITSLGGTHVCLRKVSTDTIAHAIAFHKAAYLCGAPIIMKMLIAAAPQITHSVNMMTAAAPPPPSILGQLEEKGVSVTHVYGLTETYGPATVCEPHREWADLNSNDRAAKLSRQGVGYHVLEELSVRDPETLEPVPADGVTMGEVMMRGNIVMKGYYNNEEETNKSFANNQHLRTGDLAVMHPDNYIQIKDRSKDIIISGGENISSIEIESALYKHGAVAFAAVVGIAHDKWGEVPCACVELKPNNTIEEKELLLFLRSELAGFKIPKKVVFMELPKTSTGKIQKNVLRGLVRDGDGDGVIPNPSQ